MRELRGIWIATVGGIDWPRKGAPAEKQKADLVAQLDKAVELNMNCIVLQVRPMADAFYKSEYEPWSEFLTGEMGKDPGYDPLQFAIDECHKRGLELHCWFNPYRAGNTKMKGPWDKHIRGKRPDLVKQYGEYYWMDPGEKDVQDYSINVIVDCVRRYDIDGVHMDDYFYPYKVKGPDGKILDFPDEPSWQKYVKSGGTLGREDWRRQNVDKFIQRLYTSVHKVKPQVRVGLSPFGIWKPGFPEQVKGLNQYDELYADARLWLQKGWVDYWTPQLYWLCGNPDQSYPVLLKWWMEQNIMDRNVYPGLFTSKIGEGGGVWNANEIKWQILWTRLLGAKGNVHFSMKAFTDNMDDIDNVLTSSVYAAQALVPPSPWLGGKAPGKPSVTVALKPAPKVTPETKDAIPAAEDAPSTAAREIVITSAEKPTSAPAAAVSKETATTATSAKAAETTRGAGRRGGRRAERAADATKVIETTGPIHVVSWKAAPGQPVWLWVVYSQIGEKWSYKICPMQASSLEVKGDIKQVAVSAVDRLGNESEKAVVWTGPAATVASKPRVRPVTLR